MPVWVQTLCARAPRRGKTYVQAALAYLLPTNDRGIAPNLRPKETPFSMSRWRKQQRSEDDTLQHESGEVYRRTLGPIEGCGWWRAAGLQACAGLIGCALHLQRQRPPPRPTRLWPEATTAGRVRLRARTGRVRGARRPCPRPTRLWLRLKRQELPLILPLRG